MNSYKITAKDIEGFSLVWFAEGANEIEALGAIADQLATELGAIASVRFSKLDK